MSTVGITLLEQLEALGVTHAFGIPGNHTLELYRGLERTSIRHITARHEQGAAFMADGFARVAGAPGVCLLIGGPGLMNAATAITQANQDSIPLLVLTTTSERDNAARALHQMPDQLSAARGISKAVLQIRTTSEVASSLATAFDLCQQGRPGAVILQIAVQLLDEPLASPKTAPTTSAELSAASSPSYTTAAALMLEARKPLLVLGGGAKRSDTQRLAEVWDAPVVNTVNGKGILPSSHPLAVGGSPSLPCIKQAMAEADVILAVGTEFSETDYDLLMDHTPQRQGKLIWLNFEAPTQADVWLNTDANTAVLVLIEQLTSQLAPQSTASHNTLGSQRAQHLRNAIKAELHYHQDMASFFDALHAVNDDLILVGDSTRPTYYATWMYETNHPARYFHSAAGFGTLGYALPAAFGAKLATDLPVVGLIGDGGAQFTLTELAAAVDHEISVPIIIWQNRGYEEITNSLKARGVSASTTDVSAPDYTKIASAYGIPHFTPKTPGELTSVLQEALTSTGPTLVIVEQSDFTQTTTGDWYG